LWLSSHPFALPDESARSAYRAGGQCNAAQHALCAFFHFLTTG
jgi:hypothetical protein